MTKLVLALFLSASFAYAQQQPPPPVDPSAPSISLEEKISLTTDEVKKSDALEAAQKAFLAATKPIQDHQDATKALIEKEHPGWLLENGPQGWHLTKKPEATKPEKK